MFYLASDVTYKMPGYAFFDTMSKKKAGVLILVNLLKVKTIY